MTSEDPLEHFPYLFAAYTIVWIVLYLYVFWLDRRERRTERDLEELKRLLQGGGRGLKRPEADRG